MNISNENDSLMNINKLYKNSGFFQKYGADIFSALLIIIFFLIIFFYFTSKNELKKIKYKWNIERCNPKYMPFAGYIMEPQDKSNFEYTMDNFFYCTDGLLNKIGLKHLNPIELLTSITDVLINTLGLVLATTFNILNNLSLNFNFAFGQLKDSTIAITNPFITLLTYIDGVFKKFQAFIYVLFYIFVGMVKFMYSLVQAAYDNLVKSLILLSILVISIFILFPISIPLLLAVLIPLSILADKLKIFLDKKEGFKEGFFKKAGKKIKKQTGINKLIKATESIWKKIKEAQKAQNKATKASEGMKGGMEKKSRNTAGNVSDSIGKYVGNLFKKLVSLKN